MRNINKKGFTLIELLAVIVIMGILMAIAIPSISLVITNSRKDIFINSALTFINEAEKEVINSTFEIDDPDTTYYIHIANLVDDRTNLGKSGFATWGDAYVVVAMDLINDKVNLSYYFNGADIAGWKIALQEKTKLKKTDIFQDTRKTVDYRPIDKRSKIVVYDENGNIDTTKTPYTEMSRTEAKKCYSFQNLSDTTARLTWYNPNCGPNVIIPNRIENRDIIEIYNATFANMGLENVVISSTVKKIGYRAFAYNKLTTITIPKNVQEIGEEAFLNNQIIKLNLQKELVKIGARAFRYNKISEDISTLVPGPNTTIGTCAFCNNNLPSSSFLYKRNSDSSYDYSTIIGYIGDLKEFSDKTFIVPAEKENIKLTTIANGAFTSMSLYDWKVVLPSTLKTLGSLAFAYDGISEINLPDGLEKIGSSALYSNNLKELHIPSSVTSIDIQAFNVNKVTSGKIWIYERTKSGINYEKIIGYSGANRNNITVPTEKNGVTLKSLGRNALNFLSLTGKLTLPAKIKFDGTSIFTIGYLTSVDNGDGVLTDGFIYGRKADGTVDNTYLYGYSGAKKENVQIPSTIKIIGNSAFHYSEIKSVIIPEGVETIGDNAFTICHLTGKVVIPSTVTYIGRNAFQKYNPWVLMNGDLVEIVNKTGRVFDWKAITDGPSEATFETGVVENWYGDITVTK